MKKIDIKLNEILIDKGITKAWLSDKTGITSYNICRLANGQSTQVTASSLEKICKALNITVGDLIAITEVRKNVDM